MIEESTLKTSSGAGFPRFSRGLRDTAKELRARMREGSFGPGSPDSSSREGAAEKVPPTEAPSSDARGADVGTSRRLEYSGEPSRGERDHD